MIKAGDSRAGVHIQQPPQATSLPHSNVLGLINADNGSSSDKATILALIKRWCGLTDEAKTETPEGTPWRLLHYKHRSHDHPHGNRSFGSEEHVRIQVKFACIFHFIRHVASGRLFLAESMASKLQIVVVYISYKSISNFGYIQPRQ